jgi:uncharacterized protein YjcR
MDINKEILFVEDIAEILNIKTNTIHSRRWQIRYGCPLIKHGKRLMVMKDEFWDWFKNGMNSLLSKLAKTEGQL